MAQNADVFTDICIASRTKSKCDATAEAIRAKGYSKNGVVANITTAQVDADNVPELVALMKEFKPELCINLALPYQDLTIMDACLEAGVNYMDTANYEPKDEAHFEYSWQWAYRERFEKAGLCAILGCGFDPGVTSIFTAYAAKHHFKEIQYLDIVDCNAGNHHKAFATNFNPEINIREITQKGLYYENGKYIETEPMEIHKPLTYPGIGPKESYLLHHEEIESLVINYPTIKRARFWMTFGQQYLTYLDVIQNIGMSRIDEIEYKAPLAARHPLPTARAMLWSRSCLCSSSRPCCPIPRNSARTTTARPPSAAASVVSKTARSTPIIYITTASIRMLTRKQACKA